MNVQYAFYMASRPQTLYAIADSPVGLAAWLLDHDPRSLEMIGRSFDGVPEGLTRDDVLDNCTHFWLTNTGVSSSRLYRENPYSYLTSKGVTITYEGRRGPGGNPGVEFLDPDGYQIEIYACMGQIGSDGRSRPAGEWNRATTLEEAVSNPLPGAEYH